MKISPYVDSVNSTSPNGRFTATMKNATEIRMGSPTLGTLELSNGMKFEGCNPAVIWSDDSRHLAALQITPYRRLRLLIIAPAEKRFGYATGFFASTEIHSFAEGKIKGRNCAGGKQQREVEAAVVCRSKTVSKPARF